MKWLQQSPSTARMSVFASLLCLVLGPVLADDAGRFSQSVEGVSGAELEAAEVEIELAPVESQPALVESGPRLQPETAARTTAAALVLPLYRIFDAYSVLSRDDDDDGFYHRLRVVFDADVEVGEALVYAQLYLSYNGGPWNHYFTTDVFHIVEDSEADEYSVVTDLLDGYRTGYYDVLIELYDADLDVHVASYGPADDLDLFDLPLEDRDRDYDGGGGAVGLYSLLLLGLLRGLALRRRSARI